VRHGRTNYIYILHNKPGNLKRYCAADIVYRGALEKTGKRVRPKWIHPITANVMTHFHT